MGTLVQWNSDRLGQYFLVLSCRCSISADCRPFVLNLLLLFRDFAPDDRSET